MLIGLPVTAVVIGLVLVAVWSYYPVNYRRLKSMSKHSR
jgi:hypothetical protein